MITPSLRRGLLVSFLLLPGLAPASSSEGGPIRHGDPSSPEDLSSLVESALERLHDGDEPGAFEALRDGIIAQLSAGPLSADVGLEAAHMEVALLTLDRLAGELDRRPELVELLDGLDEGQPPAVAFRLERTRLGGLLQSGRLEEAAALRMELGYLTDLLVIGPFDNERGVGLRTAYPPERGIILGTSIAGKERDVAWRALPAAPPNGRIPLDSMLRPREQAVAYLTTALHAREAGPAVLRIGSSGPVQVFHAGEKVFETDVERPLRDDQDRAVLSLAAGWNTLLVKSAVEEGSWGIVLRLTDLEGNPLRGVEVDPARSGQQQAMPPEMIALPAGEAVDLLGNAREDAAAQRALARYLLLVHPQDTTGEEAIAAARQAVRLEPASLAGSFLLAEALYPAGRSRAEMAIAPHLQQLAEVLGQDPGHVGALLARAEVDSSLKSMPDRLDETTRTALEVAPKSARALLARARYLDQRGRGIEARLLQERASELPGFRDLESSVLRRLSVMKRRGEVDEAMALLGEAHRSRPGHALVARELAEELADRGRLDELIALFDYQLALRPFSVRRRLEAAGLAEGVASGGRPASGPAPAAARRWVEEAHVVAPEDTSVLRWRARLDLREGEVASARANLEAILRIDPGDDDVRRQLELLSASETEQRFEEPWRRDALGLEQLPMPDGSANDPLEVLDRTTVYRVYADGGESRYEHMVWRVLNQTGVSGLDRYGIVYPRSGALHVHTVRVIRKDGTSERAPAPARRDLTQGQLAMRPFDLPPLSPGDLVDVEYRVDETTPDVFGEYFGTSHGFYPDRIDGLAPTRRSQLVVIAPTELPIYSHVRRGEELEHEQTTDEQGNLVHSWIARDLQRPPLESAMPGAEELMPLVELSTYPDWQAFSRWWWSFIEKEFDSSEALRSKVAELTDGLATEEEKVQAIYRFVAQEIRYNAWSFGTHGYEPFSAATIFERRFGDCKDKSILLRQMLGQIGVEAVPVLIQAERFRPEEDLSVARVGHFNHCIAYVEPTDSRPGFYLDATADRNPIEYLRFDDQGARVLHVTPEGGELHEIPFAAPEENAVRRTWTIDLDAAGNAEVQLRDESTGQYAVALRYRFGGERGDVAKVLAEELSSSFGQVELDSVESSELDDVSQPAWLEARFRATELGTLEGPRRRLVLTYDQLGLDGLAIEPGDGRVHDVVLDRPFRQETVVRYLLPAGAELAGLPGESSIEAPGLVRYRVEIDASEPDDEGRRRVEVRRLFELLERRIALADYDAFRAAIEDVRVAEERTLSVLGEVTLPEGMDREEGR